MLDAQPALLSLKALAHHICDLIVREEAHILKLLQQLLLFHRVGEFSASANDQYESWMAGFEL